MFEIKMFDELPELFEHLSEQLMALSFRNEACHIALSGGSTPLALYRFILNHPVKETIEWANLHFWWGDERMVDVESNQSNFGEAYRALLQHVPIPEGNLHPVQGTSDLENELGRLEQSLNEHLMHRRGRPSFDWIILGVGEDGHTASLFPGQTDYDAPTSWVQATHPDSGQIRISLSAQALCNAEQISYLATGAGKAAIVKAVFADDDESENYPAANIFAYEGETHWLLDNDAARLLIAD